MDLPTTGIVLADDDGVLGGVRDNGEEVEDMTVHMEDVVCGQLDFYRDDGGHADDELSPVPPSCTGM